MTKARQWLRLLAATLFVLCAGLCTMSVGRADVNLGIADDETFKRPNSWGLAPQPLAPNEALLAGDLAGPASRPGMSIAWRNANQVEEVEVRVRNLGSDAGRGRVYVDVLDETGKQLLRLTPPDDQKVISVPAVDRGGREGKILRMKANWSLNTLIDAYDRAHRRYDVRATVETIGPDSDPSDNAKVKSWNIPFAVHPGGINVYSYTFQNHETQTISVRWRFEHTPYPPGWNIEGVPAEQAPITLQPGQQLTGNLLMHAPQQLHQGDFVEARLSLIRADNSSLFQQHEWFQVYDVVPPVISNYKLVNTEDHHIGIQALVTDKDSGVLEATGVVTEFSTDGGHTWAITAHNYKSGNFVKPTLFEAVIGPFVPGTKLMLRMMARDTAGNIQTVIPTEAVGIAPTPTVRQTAMALFRQDYVFPRTRPSAIFALPASQVKTFALHRVSMPGDDLINATTLSVVVK
jgi:hypothetical protein